MREKGRGKWGEREYKKETDRKMGRQMDRTKKKERGREEIKKNNCHFYYSYTLNNVVGLLSY